MKTKNAQKKNRKPKRSNFEVKQKDILENTRTQYIVKINQKQRRGRNSSFILEQHHSRIK